MDKITTVGLDLAKSVFSVHGVDASGRCVLRKTMPGVGPLTASAITASVASGHEFRNGRQFAAWLGLVPRQHSTAGKTRLGRITKRGDAYLRTLLMLGARAVLQNAAAKSDRLSRWARSLRERRGYHRTIIAIAAKNARIIWVLLAKERNYVPVG